VKNKFSHTSLCPRCYHKLVRHKSNAEMAKNMNYSLEVENLSKSFGKSDFSLQNVSFKIPNGSIMGFVGENGAGKTTTISAILNILRKDSGEIKLFEQEMNEKNTEIREDIGVVFDAINFPSGLTAQKISKVMGKIYKKWNQEYYSSMIEKLNIPKNQKIKEFSRGMSMKLAIVVALSHNPKLLILDEATSGLDPIIREELLDIFLEFVEDENHSILMSSHITSDLEKIADYITFIHKGEIILTEKKDTLMYEYGIVRCKPEQLPQIKKEDYLTYRKRGHQIDMLIKDKKAFERRYENMIVDSATIDDTMRLLIKGEK